MLTLTSITITFLLTYLNRLQHLGFFSQPTLLEPYRTYFLKAFILIFTYNIIRFNRANTDPIKSVIYGLATLAFEFIITFLFVYYSIVIAYDISDNIIVESSFFDGKWLVLHQKLQLYISGCFYRG